MKWKSLAALALCVLMLACMSITAAATPDTDEEATSMETVSKVYSLHISSVQGFIQASPTIPAFWEYPALRGGEDYVEGTLVLRNESEVSTSLKLTSVLLPYGDAAKLNYLDHLMLTVKDGDTVIYDNTYAHVNDEEGGLRISLPEMKPGDEKVYTIKLRCLYSYDGNPIADAAVLNWNFEAQMLRPLTQHEEAGALPDWVMISLIALAVTVVLVGVIVIIYAIVMKRAFPKEKTAENSSEEEKKE